MSEQEKLHGWPHDGQGRPEEAALLCTQLDYPDALALFRSLLESFGIPYYLRRTGSGSYMNLLFGHSTATGGVEVYVPASRLAEARELLSAPSVLDDAPPEK